MNEVKDNAALLYDEPKETGRKDMPCPLEPTGSGIVVLGDTVAEVSKGGIYMPNANADDPETGFILVVGPDVDTLHVGQHVLFGAYDGKKVEMNGGKWLLMEEEDVLAIIMEQ